MFCEANKGLNLGKISTIPIAQTFDLYLEFKVRAITLRSNGKYQKPVILRLLLDIVGKMWQKDDVGDLSEIEWNDQFFSNLPNSEKEELISTP